VYVVIMLSIQQKRIVIIITFLEEMLQDGTGLCFACTGDECDSRDETSLRLC
jgi:hypothetical protein